MYLALKKAVKKGIVRLVVALPVGLRDDILRVLAVRSPEKAESILRDVVPEISHRQIAYAQEGEDLVLSRIFGARTRGFYVDIGAHHPFRFSNTYLLFKKGWRGINIDAAPGAIDEFNRARPYDINIEALVSSTNEPQTFYMFDEPALNTSSPEVMLQREQVEHFKVASAVKVVPRTLKSILDEELPPGQRIDVLNIDVEGAELHVLRSNDWTKYRPRVIVVELLRKLADEHIEPEVERLLTEQGYRLFARFYNSAMFLLADEDIVGEYQAEANARRSLVHLDTIFLINQISGHGHLDMYARIYSETLLGLGYRVILITVDTRGTIDWLRGRGANTDRFTIFTRDELHANYRRDESGASGPYISLLARALQVWKREGVFGVIQKVWRRLGVGVTKRGGKVWRAVRGLFSAEVGVSLSTLVDEINTVAYRAECRPDLVFFLYADMLSSAQSDRAYLSRFLNAPWASLIFHPLGISRSAVVHYERYLLAGRCVGAGFLNPRAVEVYERSFPKWAFGALPDVTDSALPERPTALAERVRALAAGRPIVLSSGSIVPHKGPLRLAEVISKADPDELFFVIIGEVFWESFGADQEALRRFLEAPPRNCFVLQGYIDDERELNSIIDTADIIYSIYDGFSNSSNSLTKAASFEKKVIVSNKGLMAERVLKYNLGAVVRCSDIDGIVDSLRLLAKRPSQEFGFAAYRQAHSLEKLRQDLGALMARWLSVARASV